jgi:hypothetical protein
MATKLTDLEIVENSGVDHPAHRVEGWLVMKNLETVLDAADGTNEPEPSGGKVDDEATGVEDVEETEDAATDDLIVEDVVDEEETVESELTPVAASANSDNDALAKELTDLRKEAAEAKSLAKALMDERDTNAAITKAEEWRYVPAIAPADFGPLLKNLREIAPEETAQIEKVLDSTNAMLSESAFFTELGTVGHESGSSFDELDAVAQSLVKSGDSANYADAVAKATRENPVLAMRYREDRIGRR